MRANKFFLTRRLWNKGLLFKTCLMLILSTSASLASICSLVHGNCEDYDANGTSHPAYVGSDVSKFVSDKQDGISGCAGFSDKGAAPHANGAPWPAYARKKVDNAYINNRTQYACSACKKTVNNREVVVVDLQGYARWNCYRKCDDEESANYVKNYDSSKYASRPYRDRFVRSQAQCNERYPKVAGSNEWPTKYIEITPNVCGKCKPIENLTDDEKCEDGMALSSYPTDSPCYYACKKSYTLEDGTECCAASSWEKMPEDYHPEFWTGKCYNTKTEKAANGKNCYKQTEIKVRATTNTSSAPRLDFYDDSEDWEEDTSGTTNGESVSSESDEEEVVCDAGKVWNDYGKSYDSAQDACACVFVKCEGNMVRGGEDGVTCVACGEGLQANADHTACGCPSGATQNDNGECVCTREGSKIVNGACMCPAGTYATVEQRAPNCPAGMQCAPQSVMVCAPCRGQTYADEPNVSARCKTCGDGLIPNDDHTGCVCANGGLQNDSGECVCPTGSRLTNGLCVCDEGFELVDGTCQCPAGKYIFETEVTGKCRTDDSGREYCSTITVRTCEQCPDNAISTEINSTTCTQCENNKGANADHTACGCPSGATQNDNGECVCTREGSEIVNGACMCPAGTYATVEQRAPNCPAGMQCAPQSVMVCAPCMGQTYADEPNVSSSCKTCGDGLIPNEDRTGCVCANGGELINGECGCPTGQFLYNGQCIDDPCATSSGRTAVACPAGVNGVESISGSTCNYCYSAGSAALGHGGVGCYMRGTETCEDGYDYETKGDYCTAQDKFILFSTKSFGPCGPCSKCVDEDPCKSSDATWSSTLPDPSTFVNEEDNKCYFYSNDNTANIGNSQNTCFKPQIYGMGATEEECAAKGANRVSVTPSPTPCGGYECKCPDGMSFNEDNTRCVCANGGQMNDDGKCVCPQGKVEIDGQCISDPCGVGRSSVACTGNGAIEEKTATVCRWCTAAGTVGSGPYASMACYQRFTDTCATGYSFLETEASCAAQNKVAVYQAQNSTSPCQRLCVKCECPSGTTAADNGECICNNGGDFINGLCVCGDTEIINATTHQCEPCPEGMIPDENRTTCVCKEGELIGDECVVDTCTEAEYPYVKSNDSGFTICTVFSADTPYYPACEIYQNGNIKECTTKDGVNRFGCADGYRLKDTKCILKDDLDDFCKSIDPLYSAECEESCHHGQVTACQEINVENVTCYMALSSPCDSCSKDEKSCMSRTCAGAGYLEPGDCTPSCTNNGLEVKCEEVNLDYGLTCVARVTTRCVLCNLNTCRIKLGL